MNVSDYKDNKEYVKYMVQGIIAGMFKMLDSLIDAYVKIEGENDPQNPYNIHRNLDINNTRDQLIIKILSQRVMEELGEMKMAESEGNWEHVKEEFEDALIFATEMMILLGVHPDQFNEDEIFEDNYTMTFENRLCVYEYLTSATNCLKNKSWKKDQVLVDEKAFWRRILKFYAYLLMLGQAIMKSKIDVFVYFYAKWATNKFRQISNY
jgi:hypothetical protein